MATKIRWVGLALAVFVLAATSLHAQQVDEVYKMPPQAIADLADAPPTPRVLIGPQKHYLLTLERPGLPPIADVAQPELRLAGLRINPRNNGPSRLRYYNAMKVTSILDGRTIPVKAIPDDARISNVRWSPDGRWVAFTMTGFERIELWALDMNNGKVRRLSRLRLNASYADPYTWFPDSKAILALVVDPGRGEAPSKPDVPTGPIIQQNIGGKAPARTYQDLLTNAYDRLLFEYYATSQPVRITLDGKELPVGRPGIIREATPSPDGKYILVETIHKPFSYTVPVRRFPRRIEVWDRKGELVYQVADLPLADKVPTAFGSVRTGPRHVGWRQDTKAMLYWVEALDGGDAGSAADRRDRILMLAAPFDRQPDTLATLALRFGGIRWGDKNLAVISEWWWKTRRERYWAVDPHVPQSAPRLLIDHSWEDRYHDPGIPVMTNTKRGTRVLLMDNSGRSIVLIGDGASDEGDRPFLDEFNLKTKTATRLFRSQAPYYERPVDVINIKQRILITRRESVSEPPNYYLRNLKTDGMQQLTTFPDPTPALDSVQKQLIHYKRADGLSLTATLYLPAGYSPDQGPLPMLMWAYPLEFKSADAAGQVTDSPYRFVRISQHSPLFWLVHGYAILDNPAMPIVGEGDAEPNDTYVEQLVADAKAAVDEVVRRGVTDRDHIAIGGHSYGAFMAANLLAHSDLFRLGIARSGAYNRTLTPFGFQSEERTLWQAPEVYFAMSPFMHADKINEPILLIHGEADNNSGTFPLQSKRFYAALKGLGATARLVMLPAESHGYRARESVMHMLYEMTDWLDRYVKNAGPRETTGSETTSPE